jgi:hypothetical protein
MEDLISRKAAIDALRTCQTYLFYTHDPDNKISLESAEYEIEQLPSAQQEQRSFSCGQENDMISRQAAIDALKDRYYKYDRFAKLEELVWAINTVPSVQPEPLTDKEQRIFLAAMGREKAVCKQVDEECRDTREPYEDSLVRVCKEIERKVKGALWT